MTRSIAKRGRGAAVVLALSLLLAAACGEGEEEARPEPTTPVRVMRVEKRRFNDYFELIGTTRARNQATLVFEVPGVVEKIHAEQGTSVEAGAPIASLDDDLYRSALEEAAAARDLAVDLYERSRGLREKGGISEYELARLAREREMAEARYRTAEARHDRTVLRAPFSGLVDRRFLDLGDYATSMAPFARLLDIESMKVEIPVPEISLGKLRVGDRAEIRADPWPKRVFEGTVSFVSCEVDGTTRTVNVEVTLPNEERILRPGMTVRAKLVRDVYEDAVVVPQDAVVETEEGQAVFLARDGEAVLRPVKVGPLYGQMALIEEGLKEGEPLIVRGNRDLVEGERVEVLTGD